MVEIELDHTPEWDENQDWQILAKQAVHEAISVTEFAGLSTSRGNLSVSILLSNNAEIQTLNAQWRDKDKPTNVLSFPMLEREELRDLSRLSIGEHLLGDIILAHEICGIEAKEKDIPLHQHVTHLIVHGTLHLLGYDHIEDIAAEHMEALEVKALASMGLHNPYADTIS